MASAPESQTPFLPFCDPLRDFEFRYDKRFLTLTCCHDYNTAFQVDMLQYGGYCYKVPPTTVGSVINMTYHDPVRNIRCVKKHDFPGGFRIESDGSSFELSRVIQLMAREIERWLDEWTMKEMDIVMVNAPKEERDDYVKFLKAPGFQEIGLAEGTARFLRYLKENNIACHLVTTPCFLYKINGQSLAGEVQTYHMESLEKTLRECEYDRFTFYCANEYMTAESFEPRLAVRAHFHNLRKKSEFMEKHERMIHLLKEKVNNFSMFDDPNLIWSPYIPVTFESRENIMTDYQRRLTLTNV